MIRRAGRLEPLRELWIVARKGFQIAPYPLEFICVTPVLELEALELFVIRNVVQIQRFPTAAEFQEFERDVESMVSLCRLV